MKSAAMKSISFFFFSLSAIIKCTYVEWKNEKFNDENYAIVPYNRSQERKRANNEIQLVDVCIRIKKYQRNEANWTSKLWKNEHIV